MLGVSHNIANQFDSAAVRSVAWTIGAENAFTAKSESSGHKGSSGSDLRYRASAANVMRSSFNSSYGTSAGDAGVSSATVSGVTWTVGKENSSSACAGGSKMPQGQSGQHYYGDASSILGSSLDTGGNGDSPTVTTTNESVQWKIGDGNGFTSYGTGSSAVLGASSNSINRASHAEVSSNANDNGLKWSVADGNAFSSYAGDSAVVLGASCNSGDRDGSSNEVVIRQVMVEI
jgi:hypothetical protein